MGSYSGGAQRSEMCRQALTWPEADRRERQSSIEHLEADRRNAASPVEMEDGAALLEAPRCSGDRRRGFLWLERRFERGAHRRRRVSGRVDSG